MDAIYYQSAAEFEFYNDTPFIHMDDEPRATVIYTKLVHGCPHCEADCEGKTFCPGCGFREVEDIIYE